MDINKILHWSAQAQVVSNANAHGSAVAHRTSPAALVYEATLYVFWADTQNGISYSSTLDGSLWTEPKQVPIARILPDTAPTLSLLQGENGKTYLLLIWHGILNDGLFYAIFDGLEWGPQHALVPQNTGLAVTPNTSPGAVQFNGRRYAFWHGIAQDGIWFSTSDTD